MFSTSDFNIIQTLTKKKEQETTLKLINFTYYNLILSANEHDNPVPSGSTWRDVILPSSTTIEYLLLRV